MKIPHEGFVMQPDGTPFYIQHPDPAVIQKALDDAKTAAGAMDGDDVRFTVPTIRANLPQLLVMFLKNLPKLLGSDQKPLVVMDWEDYTHLVTVIRSCHGGLLENEAAGVIEVANDAYQWLLTMVKQAGPTYMGATAVVVHEYLAAATPSQEPAS